MEGSTRDQNDLSWCSPVEVPETPPHVWVRLSDSQHIKKRLRISLTDSCNLRCFFCHNEGQGPLKAGSEELITPTEIKKMVRVALHEGVSKIKLTGGEPLLYRSQREGILDLVRAIVSLRDEGHRFDLSVTTNGTLMKHYALSLRRVGLDRATISLTTANPTTFRSLISDRPALLANMINGLRAAGDAGLRPLKLNVPLYYSERTGAGNLDELDDILNLAIDCGVCEMRIFTLLWHEGFEGFREYYQFFSVPVKVKLENLFEGLGVPEPRGTVDVLSSLATVFADRAYPKVEFGVDISGLRLGFEAMKFGRLPSLGGLQEGPYAMRISADGALRPTLESVGSYDLISGIRTGLGMEDLKLLYRKTLEGMP